MNCMVCGKPLNREKTGLSDKRIGRLAATLYCLSCMSVKCRISEGQLRKMAEHFRRSWRTLFT